MATGGTTNLSSGGSSTTGGQTSTGGQVATGGTTSVKLKATAITAGSNDSCALLSDGTIQCWGNNQLGKLGNGTSSTSSVPVTVTGVTSAMAVSAGSYHTCAVLTGGTVRCWGDNSNGELGNGTTTDSSTANPTPVSVSGITTAVTIASGGAQHLRLAKQRYASVLGGK